MKKLNIDSSEFDSILSKKENLSADETRTNCARITNTDKTLDVSVKISRKNKLLLQDILRKKEKETGRFTAVNRFIDEILTEYIESLRL